MNQATSTSVATDALTKALSILGVPALELMMLALAEERHRERCALLEDMVASGADDQAVAVVADLLKRRTSAEDAEGADEAPEAQVLRLVHPRRVEDTEPTAPAEPAEEELALEEPPAEIIQEPEPYTYSDPPDRTCAHEGCARDVVFWADDDRCSTHTYTIPF